MQEALRERGLYAGGSRDELEERLREAIEDEEVCGGCLAAWPPGRLAG